MEENPNEEKETIRVTSSCWLSKRKISNLNRNKHQQKDGSPGGIEIKVPNFNICLTSLSLPIIKLKNDLDRISENKQIKRLRENRGGQTGCANGSFNKRADASEGTCVTLERCVTRQGRLTNDDEVCSMLLRSKAFNETWRVLNSYMNCFVYNSVNEMVDREINFLNKNLCLRDDKVSLLIVKTQTCPFVNLLQYRALSQKLKEVNGCAEGVAPDERRDRGRAARVGGEGEKEAHVNDEGEKEAHVGDEGENEARVAAEEAAASPRDNTNTFTYKTFDNRVLTYTLLRRRRHIASCIVNVYTHDSVESILIRIIKKINRRCFMKIDKNNMNELFQKMEINSINISVIITNNCILSALSNLDYFVKKNSTRAKNVQDPCPEGGEKYTKKFSTFKGEMSNYLNQLHVGDLRQKFVLLLYASNFYEAHIAHLKAKGRHHTLYLMSEVCAGGEGSHTAEVTTICEDPDGGKTNLPNEQNGPPLMEKRQRQEEPTTDKGKNKRALLTEEENNHIGDKPHQTSKELSKKRKIKNDFFYNCIRYLNFAKSEQGENHQGEESSGGRRVMGSSHEKEGTVQNEVPPMWNHPNEKSDFPNRAEGESTYPGHPSDEKNSIYEIIELMHKDSIKRRLKSSDHLRSCYFQNYVSHNNLAECLSPMNRIVNKDFVDDCNCVKLYVINNLTEHMKEEHNFNSLEVLKKEWKNNEYWKIQQYENVLAKMEKKIQNGKGKGSKKRAPLGKGKRNGERGGEHGEVHPQVALLYLHKCLAKSISKRMIALLYKKKKYNICLSIINTILKNIPMYSSMRKRVHILKELFKKYEQKFFIYNVKDLTKANEEIEKEFKQMVSTVCDILLNLYMSKINVLKKILHDISNFLESVKYVIKLEKYITEKDFSGLNLETFIKN
ncbi:hypothetical protein PCYB_071980 [Plasmodium cynomolgi strain B]|uniref:Uncharacterized protein n=1 Tax=Plasmodium cynomolgi (strain B) TaxID=1120755 RepID=K6UCZ2_PLACD|nr:hypothetical protein PCYB_071980 [Plasmodium cynomolgi strain B]GAB65696.1 hypothetical protein PCYB_071980 [Plasmodium cynomolgi strain B]